MDTASVVFIDGARLKRFLGERPDSATPLARPLEKPQASKPRLCELQGQTMKIAGLEQLRLCTGQMKRRAGSVLVYFSKI
jgi:hypothetical protein